MEIAIAIFSWLTPLLFCLLLLSLPADVIVGLTKKDWKESKARKIYNKIQLGVLGVFIVVLLITVVLITGTF